MPTVPRFDQVTDFARNRAMRFLGGDGLPGRIGRLSLDRAGGERGRRTASYAHLLHQLDRGRQVPLGELVPAVAQQLDAADAVHERGHRRAAAALVDRALRLAYHPSAHYGPLGSPLMLHAERFLAPLRASSAARAMLFDPDPPSPPSPSSEHEALPSRKILVLSHSSWTFIDRVVADLREHTDLEIRTMDLSTLPLDERPTHALAVRMREEWNRARRLRPVPGALEDGLRWADTVIVEWGTYPFAWFSFLNLSPFDLRVVARIHRFESLTPYPLLARSSAYDQIAFVAPTVRTLLLSVSPRLEQAGSTRVLPNVHDLSPFSPGMDRDRFELVQIGWAVPVKGVEFSLDVLERLRSKDPRYHLTLVGPGLEDTTTSSTASWASELRERIEDAGDGVRQLGYRSDVPEILAGAGFLLSSSRIEGTHESVAEAAAAGCVPIVRNWPEMAPWGGAAAIYPQEWIVEDADAATQRILSLAAPEALAAQSQQCRDWVSADRDPASIRHRYVELLGAVGSATRS